MNGSQAYSFSRKLMAEGLGAMTCVAMMFSLYMIFIYVPTERVLGPVQRIVYIHVPLTWIAYLAFFIVFAASIASLIKRDHTADALAASSAEIGLVFTSLVFITGPILAKKAWDTWWTWDPMLTTTVFLWFMYAAYLILRFLSDHQGRGSRVAAVFSVIGSIAVPMVYAAIPRDGAIHFALFTSRGFGATPPALAALTVSLITFSLFFFYVLVQRLSVFTLQAEVSKLKEQFTASRIGR